MFKLQGLKFPVGIVCLLCALCALQTRAFGATGCSYPASLDYFADKQTGDFMTATDLNSRTCAIEKLEARVTQFLAGIPGGQTIKGGTGVAEGLFLQATAGNGVGAEFVKIIGGNNGAATWATFNQGKLLMGAATPTGSVSGDIVIPVLNRLAFAVANNSTSANSGIGLDASNNWIFDQPASGNVIFWRWGGTSRLHFGMVNGGVEIRFLSRSTSPPAGVASETSLFTQDNGAGKTQLCAVFPSGSPICFATEP